MSKTLFYKIMTYGCQMNVHESEKLAGILENLGYKETNSETNFDIIVFNTCCIRDTAEKHIFGNLGVIKALKNEHSKYDCCCCRMYDSTRGI